MRPATLLLTVGLAWAAGAAPARAQPDDAPATGYALSSWTASDGRGIGSVYAIVQDADRYLWLGTSEGLVRFDGARFTPWSLISDDPLPDGPVTALYVAADGHLWVGFEAGGVRRLRGSRTVPLAASLDSAGQVTEVLEDAGGDLWVVAGGTLHVLRSGSWQPIHLPWTVAEGRVFHSTVLADRSLWVATRWGAFRHVGGDAFRLETDRFVWGVTADRAGAVWTTDTVSGFRRLGSSTTMPGLEGAGYRLLSDSRGNLWVGTFSDGLWRTRAGRLVERFTLRTGLSSDSVLSLTEDHDGNIWVGTTAGLHRFTPRPLTPAENVGFVVAIEPAAAGGMWLATRNGVFRAATAFDRQPAHASGTTPDMREIFRDRNGALWIGATGGLWHLERGIPRRLVSMPTPAFNLTWISPDGRGGLWLGDGRDVLHWDGRSLQPYAAYRRDRDTTRVNFAWADRTGRLWLGHADGRITLESPAGVRQSIAPAHVWGARGRRILSIFEDAGGTVWFAGSDGLSRSLDGRFATVNSEQGLPGNRVWSIVEDGQRHLWLSMDRGIVRVARTDLDRALADSSHQLRYRLYEPSDGLAGAAIGRIESARALDGSLWFVRGGGLTVIDPTHLDHEPPPVARIEAVVANERRLLPAAGVRLEPATRRLQIDYTAVTLTSPQRLRFRYRLEGFDADWVAAGNRRTAFYTNLPPGNYRFRVEARLDDVAGAASSAVWGFTLTPAFYQTRWFAALALVSAASLVGLAWRLRLGIVRREFAAVLSERMRLSRELHDTLLQSLAAVALQIQAAAHELADHAPVRRRLTDIRWRIETHIRETRQAIWDMRSARHGVRNLGDALEESGREAVIGTEVRFSTAVTGAPRRCSPNLETHLLRIGREAVANAARHARASAIQLALDYAPESVTLRVEDDGTGFDPGQTSWPAEHYGMSTMRERVEQLGGQFSLVSRPGRGTRIEVVVPLPPTAEARS